MSREAILLALQSATPEQYEQVAGILGTNLVYSQGMEHYCTVVRDRPEALPNQVRCPHQIRVNGRYVMHLSDGRTTQVLAMTEPYRSGRSWNAHFKVLSGDGAGREVSVTLYRYGVVPSPNGGWATGRWLEEAD